MKRIAYLFLLLCCLSFTVMAQDLNPGQQSQGLLESRNVTVDYSTGIFHYQIPLYTLKSGDYELPISLRYTGKGVKVSDKPGLVGYNWTLDTGGVVTRTVRGGIPDESSPYGYLKFENDTIPLSEDALRVNRHKRDGECDIFTAVFGGKSVDFIIRKEPGYYLSLYAEPLERTDVKIECKHAGNTIYGWTVTDSDGTRYTYERMEWTTNLNLIGQISFNGISNAQYPSSWHLTRIEPVNSKAIEFKYKGTETNSPNTYLHRETRYYDTYRTKYEYGLPLEVPVYDFETYRKDFEEYLNAAMAAVQNYDLQLQMNDQLLAFEAGIGWILNPDYDFINGQRMVNRRVLGMGDFSQVSEVSVELLATLQDLVKQYDGVDYSAFRNFRMAYNILLDCVNGAVKEYVVERELKGGTSYTVISPILDAIHADERILFKYYPQHDTLYCIGKESLKGNTISAYRFTRGVYNRLDSIISLDKDSIRTEAVSMSYYNIPEGGSCMTDIYGYRKRYDADPNARYQPWADEEYAKIHSLKEIHPADGGRICLDYELNGFPNAVEGIPYGGIRIKSIVLDNPVEGRCDTVTYHYDQALFTFLDFPSNYEEEEYDGFTDKVSHSRIKTMGHIALSPGNNGIYYPQVRERISGQGTRTYLFNFTDYAPDLSYSHWITGLPVFTVEQDEEGNVERVLESLYYTDVENGLVSCLFHESLIHSEASSYNKVLPQMMANEKYMNLDDLRKEMGVASVVDWVDSNARFFWMNIAPRIREEYRNLNYSMHYGGATVLAEQREYRPQGRSYTDFGELVTEQHPCNRTVYHYDNLQKHTRPTRIVSYDSQGDSTVVHQVYVSDMAATASEDIAAMQEANILAPIVKRATVKNCALVEEEVTVYETVAKEDGCFYAPEKVVVRSGSNVSYIPDTLSLYAGNMTDYQECKEMTSVVIGGDSYLPIGVTEQGMHTALLYDPNSKWCVLQAADISVDNVLAVDCRHYKVNVLMDNTDTMGRVLYLAEKLQTGIEGYDPESIESDNYQMFRTMEYYQLGKRLVELLGKGTENVWIEISALLDTCTIEDYMGIEEYVAWQIALAYSYFPAVGVDSPWDMSVEEMNEFGTRLLEELYINNGTVLLDYLRTSGGSFRNGFTFVPQTLLTSSGQQGYKLYIVPMKEQVLVTYTVIHNGGTEDKVLELSGLTPGVLREIFIDLSDYTHVNGITITGFGAVQHLSLILEGTEFEAISYNVDGTVAFKYDRSGQMQYYEYDSAGRPVRVRDENGKALEESDYHKKTQRFE